MNVITLLGGGSYLGAASAATTAAKRLQAALVSLGKVAGSAKLKVTVDGAIGPKTADAVNWAFTQHIGPGQAPADLRTGKLTTSAIKTNAATLAGLIEAEIARRGGTAAKPSTVVKGEAVKAVTSAPPSSGVSTKAEIKRLQTAIVALGKATGSAKLKISADGVVGAKTVAAVNWAFTQHIGPGQAPAAVRTGALDLAYVKSHASTLATLVEAEVKRRAGTVPTTKPAVVAKAVSKTDAKNLQAAIYSLGKVAGSAKLQIAVDGAIGPKTVDAVNWAFTQHIGSGQAPAQFRTGKLDLTAIKANIGTLTSLVTAEVKRRGSTVKAPSSQAVAVKTKKTGKTVQATKVSTASGETYKVTDPETGQEYYTPDPTVEPAPKAPKELPPPTADQEEAAAEASAAAASQGKGLVTTPQQFLPGEDSGGGSFFDEYKWPILGGLGLVALVGIAAVALKRKPSSSSYTPPQPAYATHQRRR